MWKARRAVLCSSAYSSATVTVPLASLAAYLADGTMNVALRSSFDVNCVTCSTSAYLTLTFPMTITGTFL